MLKLSFNFLTSLETGTVGIYGNILCYWTSILNLLEMYFGIFTQKLKKDLLEIRFLLCFIIICNTQLIKHFLS